VAVLGKEARTLAATPSAPRSEAAAVLLQQAALLQTQSIERARDVVDAALRIAPDDAQALWSAAWLAYVAGKSDRAIELYGRLLTVSRADLARRPDDPLLQSTIASIYGSIGTVLLTKADYPGATANFTESLNAAKALAARDSTNPAWQRLVELGQASLGDLALGQGLSQQALDYYRRSLTIADALVTAFPAQDVLRSDLAIAQTRVGDAETLLGHADASIEAYRQAQRLVEALIAAYPGFDGNYLQLAAILSKRAYVELGRGDPPAARDSYAIAIKALRERSTRDPGNRIFQRSLEIAIGGLGDVQTSLPASSQQAAIANIGDALASYTEAAAIAIAQAGQEPGNDLLQYDLWYAKARLSSAHAMRGELQLGFDEIVEARGVIQRLVARNPQSPLFARQLGLTLTKTGQIQAGQGHAEAALASFDNAIAQARSALRLDSAGREPDRDIAFNLSLAGALRAQQGDAATAAANLREAVSTREHVAASDRGNAQWQLDVATAQGQLSLLAGVPLAERLAALRKAVAIVVAHQASGRPPILPDQFVEASKAQLKQLEQAPGP
jgi:tetratricopeptide (TPR) repeat protein